MPFLSKGKDIADDGSLKPRKPFSSCSQFTPKLYIKSNAYWDVMCNKCFFRTKKSVFLPQNCSQAYDFFDQLASKAWPEQHSRNRLPLLDGTVILVLASDIADVQACCVVALHAVGNGGIGCQLYDISVRLNYLMIPYGLPAKGFLPISTDGCDGGILRGGRAMHNKVGDGSHSSGLRRG